MGDPFHAKLPVLIEDLDPHLIHDSLWRFFWTQCTKNY